MSDYTISFRTQEPHAAAVGMGLPISPKQSQEVCRMLRGMPLEKAKRALSEVILLKKAVPFKQHYHNLGHRRGKVGPGRFPVLACKEILTIIKSAESNAQHKGLQIANLYVKHIAAQQGFHIRRRNGHRAKRAHIEVVLMESAPKKEAQSGSKPQAKTQSKDQPKTESKSTSKKGASQ